VFWSILFTIIYGAFIYYVFSYARIKFLGATAHPIGLFFVIQILIFSMPGVLMVSFFDVSSERYFGINNDELVTIGIWYLYAVTVMLLIVLFLFKGLGLYRYQFELNKIREFDFDAHWSGCILIICFCVVTIVLQQLLFEAPPIYHLMTGDSELAYLTRVDMQENPEKYYPPYVRFALNFINIFQVYYVYFFYCRLKIKKLSHALYLFISLAIATYQALYETQKAPIVFILIGLSFIGYLNSPKMVSNIIKIIFIFVGVILFSSLIIDADFNSAFTGVIDRVFLGQNQGFYQIISNIKPDEKYWFQDVYFAGSLGVNPSRADVDVIPYIYGDRDDVVNVNSFFLGQAWSMFGELGLIISPFIVATSISIFIMICDKLIKISPTIFIPFMIYTIPSLSINQSFTQFLYGKYFILNFICIFIFYFCMKFVHKIK